MGKTGVNSLSTWFKGTFHQRRPSGPGLPYGKFFHYSLSLFTCDRCINIFCVFLIRFSICFFSGNLFHSSYLLPLIISYYKVSSKDAVFIPDCSNCLFFMVSLAEGLSILLLFSKTQLTIIYFFLLF